MCHHLEQSQEIKIMLLRSLLCAALAAALSPVALSQEQPIRTITFHKIKAGEMANHHAAAKELIATLKDSGAPLYWSAWTSLTGDHEIAIVRHFANYAEIDAGVWHDPKYQAHAAKLSSIFSRLENYSESRHRVIETAQDGLVLPYSAAPPAMIRVMRITVKPERVDDFAALMRSDVMPAVKKAGLKFFNISRVAFGAPGHAFSSVAGIGEYATLDAGDPVAKAMGEAGYKAFLAKVRPMVTHYETDLYRYLKDISHLPELTTTSRR
jgi:hypothetical protein